MYQILFFVSTPQNDLESFSGHLASNRATAWQSNNAIIYLRLLRYLYTLVLIKAYRRIMSETTTSPCFTRRCKEPAFADTKRFIYGDESLIRKGGCGIKQTPSAVHQVLLLLCWATTVLGTQPCIILLLVWRQRLAFRFRHVWKVVTFSQYSFFIEKFFIRENRVVRVSSTHEACKRRDKKKERIRRKRKKKRGREVVVVNLSIKKNQFLSVWRNYGKIWRTTDAKSARKGERGKGWARAKNNNKKRRRYAR